MKNSANRSRAGSPAHVRASKASSPHRPWPLIALGMVGLTFVLLVALHRGTPQRETDLKPVQKVYSAAADTREPIAITSHQAGKLEPSGVAKPLRLFAVTTGRSNRQGLAVLGAAEDSSRTYVAGALLENGARLAEIYVDHVVLVRAAKSYSLYLPQKGRSDPVAAAGTQLTIGDFPPPQPPPTAVPVRVSDAVRVAPVYDGTQISGYSVYPGSRAAQFEHWGLKQGDVLVTLGGQSLSSSEQMESLLDQLAQGATLRGEVRRGQERITVTLDGGALLTAASPPSAPSLP